MKLPPDDLHVLRELGRRKAAIAALPVQQERIELWRRLNDLDSVRPMVWLNEVCWHEMDVDGELRLRTVDPFCQSIETTLRYELYQWDHLQGDMVVTPVMYCGLVVKDTGFGIREESDLLQASADSVPSRHFHVQVKGPEDADKIKMPVVTHDEEQTDRHCQAMKEIFDGILPVEKRGMAGSWFAPWDELIRWTGVQEAMTDLALRPEYIHTIMERLTRAYLRRLDQYEALNLLSANTDNTRVGSGAYGYTGALPPADADPSRLRPRDIWGCGTAQIFSEVSPDMHWEFALQYEVRWMQRFGLNYYGCCEPLHKKLDVLARVPNLRKISMSPWAHLPEAAEKVGRRYVFSIKPSPAILAEDHWRPDAARADLRRRLDEARGCHVEVVMKDISTVRYQPQRLWEWARMASEEARNRA